MSSRPAAGSTLRRQTLRDARAAHGPRWLWRARRAGAVAARDAGLDEVPVRYSEFDDELAEREALIEFNRQREKTPGQIVNEYEEARDIEEQRGKEKMSQGGSGERVRNVSKPLEERAAEKVNSEVSGRTLQKGKTVKDKAESDDEK